MDMVPNNIKYSRNAGDMSGLLHILSEQSSKCVLKLHSYLVNMRMVIGSYNSDSGKSDHYVS